MKHNIHYWFKWLLSLLDDDVSFFAASLSFYSVLSIIPMLWVLFFVLHQLGIFEVYYDSVKIFLVESLVPSHAQSLSRYLEAFMGNARKMGAVGLAYISIMSVLFYRNYQYVVNKIFLVPNHSLLHSLATYLVLVFIMPLVLGLSFYLSDYIQQVVGVRGLYIGEFTLLSYLMIWMLFFLLFKISPNMHINIAIALKVSFWISLIWHVVKWLFVQYMLMNQAYASLYGSFSSILFLLIWVYISWLLLLHGLKVCYLQHCKHGKYA